MSTTITPGASDARRISCMGCRKRKIKCDRLLPCSHCRKLGEECISQIPRPSKRRRLVNKPDDGVVLAQDGTVAKVIDLDEKTIEQLDSRSNSPVPNASPISRNIDQPIGGVRKSGLHPDAGQDFLTDQGNKSRYLDSHIWANLREDLPRNDLIDSKKTSGHSLEMPIISGGFLFYQQGDATDLKMFYPSAYQMQRLWDIFISNVDPLLKIVYTPSVKELLDKHQPTGFFDIQPENEALLASVFFISVIAASDSELQAAFGDECTRSSIVERFQIFAVSALANARFLRTSDLIVLEAYLLFLHAIRGLYDPDTLSSLVAIAVHIARRMGLDGRNDDILPPFVQQMRLRVVWNLIWIDGFISASCGTRGLGYTLGEDLPLPLNIDDEQLVPDLKELPENQAKYTDMSFPIIRYTIGRSFRDFFLSHSDSSSWKSLIKSGPEATAERIKSIQETLENRFLRYCDPANSIHMSGMIMSRIAIAKLYLMANHPQHFEQLGMPIPEAAKKIQFANSLKIVEYSVLFRQYSGMDKYYWQMSENMQVDCIIILLLLLKSKSSDAETRKAWTHLDISFDYSPNLLFSSERPISAALRILAWKSWLGHLEASKKSYTVPQPQFIEKLKEHFEPAEQEKSGSADFLAGMNLSSDTTEIDWTQWDKFLNDMGRI